MSVDSIGDFLTIIRNGVMASKSAVFAPYSKMRHAIAELLKQEGFVWDVIVEGENVATKKLKIRLKYVESESVIHHIARTSKLGRRVYSGAQSIKPVIGGLGVSIVTTNKGIMTDKQAKKQNVGGEIICTVW